MYGLTVNVQLTNTPWNKLIESKYQIESISDKITPQLKKNSRIK